MAIYANGGVGIDLGSSNVTICLQSEGVALREPSYVLCSRDDTSQVRAVGRQARQMLGRTPEDLLLLTPVMDGAVGDVDHATALIRGLADKALGKSRALEKARLVVSSSLGSTRVEQEALQDVVQATVAKRSALLRTPIAAAIGAGVPIADPNGCMVIVIGASTTEIAVLSMNGIAAARSTRTGSMSVDEAIVRWLRREKGIIIGLRTAEDLKIDLGSVRDENMLSDEKVALRGRDAKTGNPTTVEITAKDLRTAIERPVNDILENIREAFENTPAQMAEDILQRGVYLSGGGSLLDGLAEKLTLELGLSVTVGENPQDDVAIGCCMVASDERLAQRYSNSGCLIEL